MRRAWLLSAALCTPGAAAAEDDGFVLYEPYNTGWAFYMDNDALSLANRDQQYTGGFALTLSGRRAREYAVSLDPALKWLDRLTGIAGYYERGYRRQLHGFEIGLTAFTPEDTQTAEPIFDDRPYASLVFLANNQQTVLVEEDESVQTTFALGLLGTRIPQQVQDGIHGLIGSDRPAGWRNQISEGGELTFVYGGRWMKALAAADDGGGRRRDVAGFVGGAVGYTTIALAGLNWRYGRIGTPWWAFNPNYGVSINMGAPVATRERAGGNNELFLWGGAAIGYVFYNAFLQGQFRDSEVSFDHDRIDPWLVDLTLGVTYEFEPGWDLVFALRTQSQPLRGSVGLSPVWGGLIISRSY